AEMHYKPLGPSDDLPQNPVSIAVSMADKMDTLTGFWAIDEKPTGSKDPYALRRAALGIIRTVLGNDLRVGLERLIDMQLLAHTIALNTDTAAERDAYFLTQMVDEIADHGVFGAAFHAVVDKLNKGEDKGFEVEEGSWLGDLRASLPQLSDDLLAFFHDRLKVHLR
ncbi:glycine--tRNA ligase subunit beta, partial [Escherichia coli]|nr:glycine--tRNA ligase subunit beta [Escherichia coli]